ncbi:MAG: glycosyltransferase family 4 protein, partial [Oscillospiraceae bacterium]|nr:glycosyltransferase family 4 protein [Oscillospiraceae bacterium]
GELEILVPLSAENVPDYKNITVVRYGKRNGILWQQLDLARYLRKNKKQGIFFNNVLPLLYPHGIITVHDVCYKANPRFYSSLRDKLSMLWHRLHYFFAAHSKMLILTVSEFSKSEIIKYYKVDADRIKVIKNGWQHMENIVDAEDTFEKYSFLRSDNYYFSMSSLGANKNFKWILYCAKNNPDSVFAIAGGGKLKGTAEAEGFVNLPNVHFLGYVSDEDAKTLMAHCKAFLFPTLYEGFGIPPLEAVSCGCSRIIISDTPCMHEIYGNYADYIDPNDLNTDLKGLISDNSFDTKQILHKYDWKKSAYELLEVLKK